MKKPLVLDLFAGCGGLSKGFEKAGFEIIAANDNWEPAAETYKINHPNTKFIFGDVTKNEIKSEIINFCKERGCDVVIGGPPCQAFSTAGKRRSLEDFRGNAIISFLDIVREVKPKFFVLENVRGILSARLPFVPKEYDGKYKKVIGQRGSVTYFLVKEFQKMGYSVSFTLFNSANYGVPQIRERVIFFGHLGERVPLPSPTHSEDRKYTRKRWVSFKKAVDGIGNKEMQYIELSEKAKKYISLLSEGQNWRNLPKKIRKNAMGASYKLGGGKTGFYRRLSWSSPSPTLVTHPSMPATMLAHPEELRPLSVEEYARIQQFPSSWKFCGNMIQQYKQIGNAVPVGLGFVAGKTIMNFYKGKYDKNREKHNKVPYSRYKNCSDYEFMPLFEKSLTGQAKITNWFKN
jgi:DNA (cytosine-5)-methyltransferase 1